MNTEDKKQNLSSHVNHLISVLNAYGFNLKREKTETTRDNEDSFFFVNKICANQDAFFLLKCNRYLDNGVCWSCGMEPIENEFEMNIPGFSFYGKVFICEDCSKNDSRLDRVILEMQKKFQSTVSEPYNLEQKLAILHFLIMLAQCDSGNLKSNPIELYHLNLIAGSLNVTIEDALKKSWANDNEFLKVLNSLNDNKNTLLHWATELMFSDGMMNSKEIEFADKVFTQIGINDWLKQMLLLYLMMEKDEISNSFLHEKINTLRQLLKEHV